MICLIAYNKIACSHKLKFEWDFYIANKHFYVGHKSLILFVILIVLT